MTDENKPPILFSLGGFISNHKVKIIKSHRYLAALYGEKVGYIETEGFSSKKNRALWVKKELKDLKETEKIYAKEDKRKEDSYYAVFYDYVGLKTP